MIHFLATLQWSLVSNIHNIYQSTFDLDDDEYMYIRQRMTTFVYFKALFGANSLSKHMMTCHEHHTTTQLLEINRTRVCHGNIEYCQQYLTYLRNYSIIENICDCEWIVNYVDVCVIDYRSQNNVRARIIFHSINTSHSMILSWLKGLF